MFKELADMENTELGESLRKQLMEESIFPYVKKVFKQYPEFKSALMMVAQYWNDEADDAVHNEIIFSELDEPDIKAVDDAREKDKHDEINWASKKSSIYCFEPDIKDKLDIYKWDDNYDAIPAFAAYCSEGASQEDSLLEAYLPYALIKRVDNDISVKIVGEKIRPWLDGVKPEWS